MSAGGVRAGLHCGGLTQALACKLDALSREALEPNPFLAPGFLQAALGHLGAPAPALLLVRDEGARLTGFFALVLEQPWHGLPLRALVGWQHDYQFLGSPLVSARAPEATFLAVLDWLSGAAAPAHLLELDGMRADGPQARALDAALAARPRAVADRTFSERALLDLAGAAAPAVSARHAKDLRRLRRRLSELGALRTCRLQPGDDARPWLERFLQLEGSGWKGREGTALARVPGGSAFLLEMGAAAHRAGGLDLWELWCGERLVAAKCNLLGGEGLFMFKIAHDEAFAHWSPGLLLELDVTATLQAAPGALAWADSCARPGHFMAERLWPGRRRLARYIIATRGLARAVVARSRLARSVRDSLRG